MSKHKLGAEHWRIFGIGFGLAAGGALISLVGWQPTDEAFMNAWIGGAIGGAIGIGLGVAWHLADQRRRSDMPPILLFGLLVPSVVLASVAFAMSGLIDVPEGTFPGSADTGQAREYVRSTVNVELPEGVRAIYLNPARHSKTTFKIEDSALDSVEAAIGLDSTWRINGDDPPNYERVDTTSAGVYLHLYQRWNNLYQVTRLD